MHVCLFVPLASLSLSQTTKNIEVDEEGFLSFQFPNSEADLQVAAAFLPGRIAESHIGSVAKHLVSAVGRISERAGLLSTPVARLTAELGET